MGPAPRRFALAAALLALSAGTATAADGGAGSPLYGLFGDPAAQQLLLAARWSVPSSSLRLDTSAGLRGHELRIVSTGSTLRLPPAAFLAGAPAAEAGIDLVRATYRYTLLAEPGWEMKLGLSTHLGDPLGTARLGAADRSGFGALPMLHVAGVGYWSPRWRLAFAMDGLATLRGRALDFGVQVDYLWSPSVSIFGGYQLTDAAGDAEPYFGTSLTNRANIGLRYRF